MHVTWALLSTDRGGQTWMGVTEGRKETKAGTLELQGSPETQGVTSQHGGVCEACDVSKSCGHIYQEVYQNPLTSPAPLSPCTWVMCAGLTCHITYVHTQATPSSIQECIY